MNERKRAAACLALQAAVILGECLGIALSAAQLRVLMFTYYTCDSNILLMLAAAAEVYFCLRVLAGRERALPRRLLMLRYCATCAAALTLLVVVLIFVPMSGPGAFRQLLLTGSLKYLHLLCPLLGLLGFLFLEDLSWLRLRHTLYAMVFTVVYAAVIVILNLTGTVTGPYPFLLVYAQPVWASVLWAAVILGTAWLIAAGLYLVKKRRRKHAAHFVSTHSFQGHP